MKAPSTNFLITYLTKNSIHYYSLIFVLSLFGLIYYSAWINFAPSTCDGLGDCVKYTSIYYSLINSTYPTTIEYPFNLRVLVPFIASKFSSDINYSFFMVNLFSALTFVIFTYKSMQLLALKNIHFLILILWFLMHPLGFHLYFVIPISVDPFVYAIMSVSLYLYLRKSYTYLFITLFVGLLAKESFLFILIILTLTTLYSFLSNPSEKKLLILLGGIIEVLAYIYVRNHYITTIFPQSQPYPISMTGTIGYWLHQALNDPNRFIVWIAAILCSSGLFLFNLNYRSITLKRISSDEHLLFLVLLSLGYISFGLLAGSDMSRIILNGGLFILLSIFLLSKNIFNLTLTFLFSFIILRYYTNWFPSPIEYEYYGSQQLNKILLYLAINLFIVFVISQLTKIFERKIQ